MEDISGVNTGAAPVAGEPASGASDTAGHVAAGASAPTEQTATTNETTSGDAAAVESSLPVSEEELRAVPEQWRDKFDSLLSGYKSLEKDLRTQKEMATAWQPLQEYGEPTQVLNDLQALQGLGTYAVDEQGVIRRDENGFPYITTEPFLQSLAQRENGDSLVDQLFYDMWSQSRPDGLTYGQFALQQLGLDPARLDEYRQGASQVTQSVGVTSEERNEIAQQWQNPKYVQAYEALTAAERSLVQDYLYEGRAGEAESMLRREAERQEAVSFVQQQAQADQQNFWSTVQKSTVDAITQANRDTIANLQNQISSQVTFSADPTTNQIQTGAIGALVAALCHPETRFTMEPVLQALGVQYDSQIDGMLQQYNNAVQTYQTLKAASEHPRFAHHRNDAEMRKAYDMARGLEQRTLAKLTPIAAKIAKVFAGENQALRDAGNGALSAAQGRPTVGSNGTAQQGGARPTAQPFTVEYLQQMRQ